MSPEPTIYFVYRLGNMFLAPRLRYAARCDWTSYTVTVQKPNSGRPFDLYPYNRPDCQNQITDANATHNWITVPYVGDCGVSVDVRTFLILCIGNLLSLSY